MLDTLQHQQLPYEIRPAEYRQNLDDLTELLGLHVTDATTTRPFVAR